MCLKGIGTPAVLVIDMQNDFIAVGAPIECEGGRKIVEPIQDLISVAHSQHIPVIFTQEIHRHQQVDFGLELEYGEPVHCLEGSIGVGFYESINPVSTDFLIRKCRYSAFFATDLDLLLKGLGVTSVILTGVATDVCVRATAQDAQQLNYDVIVMPECVAGTTKKRHDAALDNIAYIFGKILSKESVLELLNQTAKNPNLQQIKSNELEMIPA